MLDPIASGILIVLGKYAPDKGARLGKEAGPEALVTAKEIFTHVLGYLRRTPKGEAAANGFQDDPETYRKPLAKELNNAVQADVAFKAKLAQLLRQYDKTADAHFQAHGRSYQAILEGSSTIAQGEGATIVGERGVYVGGNVQGSIVTGDSNIISGSPPQMAAFPKDNPPQPLPPTMENLRQKIVYHFNLEELRNLCQDMNINFENLGGKGLEGQVRELIEFCRRHNLLEKLVSECQRRRPSVTWK